MEIDSSLVQKLIFLADKYEVPSFTEEDPSQFLHWYDVSSDVHASTANHATTADVECVAFLAAMLAFGNRKQFIPKIRFILEMADRSSNSISLWLKTEDYKKDFPRGKEKFYRFYSFDDMHDLFDELSSILKRSPDATLGEFLKCKFLKLEASSVKADLVGADADNKADLAKSISGSAISESDLADIISASFPRSSLVPKGKTSANKRIYMFLRWMVRKNSPVDLGLWDWYPQSRLLIPLDTHVMQEAMNLGLLQKNSTASRKTARVLTASFSQIFPGDPARGDFALFGVGVDKFI